MIELDQRREIDASPETVFELLADPRNHQKFTPSLTDVSDVSENDAGKRGTYEFGMVGTTMTGEFADTAYDPPNRRAYDLTGDIEGTVEWTVEATDGGSRVRYRSTIDLPGPDILDTITDPVAKRFMRQEVESTLENLKVLLEEGQVEA